MWLTSGFQFQILLLVGFAEAQNLQLSLIEDGCTRIAPQKICL